ncbi:MAG TPA: hypothetical protein PK681_01565 [Steroidobacteraceae bacterium]|nr:hypothetical protein [Steroidobacteraceae bacterium]HQX47547.1 hypothetical protein [Steroidobacteraceae bacterium]HQX77673.1 hypothetical protein [Steroidobacteraceae bacterium]HQZ79285.1 hypothetical protein [Steroidobacteraceae bacterium]
MIASLSGVRAVRPASGPLNLILQGREVGTRSNATEIAFAGAAGDVPDDLEYAEVCPAGVDGGAWSVRTARGEFVIHARAAYLHRDVSVRLRGLLPRQEPPRLRRLAWAWLPRIVASPLGRRLLLAVRGR